MAVTVEQALAAFKRRLDAERDLASARAAHLRLKLPRAAAILRAHGARKVLLFGSLSAGTPTATSDVNLAVEALPSNRYFIALAELMQVFGGPVDLVRLEDASPSLRERVEAEGQPL